MYTWICAHFIVQEPPTYTYSEVKKDVNLPQRNLTQVRTVIMMVFANLLKSLWNGIIKALFQYLFLF